MAGFARYVYAPTRREPVGRTRTRGWTVFSDISEHLPQTAKVLLLRRLWHEVIDSNRRDTAVGARGDDA